MVNAGRAWRQACLVPAHKDEWVRGIDALQVTFEKRRRRFCNGASLADPAGLLEGSGKRMRHVKLSPDRQLNSVALSAMIDVAYVDIKARLDAERHSRRG